MGEEVSWCGALWDGMEYGVGILTEIEGKMDAMQYVEILEGGVMESVEKLGMDKESFYYQEDNNPKYTSKLPSKWFEDMGIKFLD